MFRLLAICLLAAAIPAIAGNPNVIFFDADESTPLHDVALVMLNQPDLKGSGVQTSILSVGEYRQKYGEDVKRATLAVVKPGKYQITGVCVLGLRDVYLKKLAEFTAGQKYVVRCMGRTPRKVKLVVAPFEG